MKRENAQLLFTQTLFVSLCFLSVNPCRGAVEKDGQMADAAFTTSQPISNGFVFVEGQYVEAPYVVSRKDLAIYINDRLIANYAPLVKELPVPEKDRPVYPSNISINAGPNDEVVTKYFNRLQNYLLVTKTRGETVDEMEKVMKTLPCIKEIRRDPGNSECVIITYLNGKTENRGLVPPHRKPAITPANAVEYVSRDCRNYMNRLQDGVVYSFSAKGSRKHSFGANIAKEVLPGVVKVLHSSLDDETKAKQLSDMLGMAAIPKEQASAFVNNISPPKQLAERVETLLKGDKSNK